MPLTLESNALPPSSPATSYETILGPNSVSITSPKFSVGTQPCYLQAFGLAPGENVRVEMVSGSHAANWRPLGKVVMMTPNTPMIRIDYPGVYRVTYSGASMPSILVQKYFGTMTHQTIYGVAPSNGGDTSFVTVIGDTPITVTGQGTATNPYHVGILNLNFAHGGIALGPNAGDDATGEFNTIIGLNAGDENAATSSIMIGSNAGSFAVNGDDNIVIGSNAANTFNGNNNIYEGTTVATNAVGSGNVVLGNSAATDLSGSNNVLIGNSVATSATTTDSVCIGSGAGDSITQGPNVFIGVTAGNSCTGLQNIAIGTQTGVISTGDNNILLGLQAGRAISASNAICIGNLAGQNATFAGGSIAIGQSAATEASGKGVYIGQNAGDGNAFDDVIVVNQATVSLQPTAAHYCMLGSSTITHTVTAGSVISGGAISASDKRLKVNIDDLEGTSGAINALRPVWFEWDAKKLEEAGIPHLKKDLYMRHAGLIAQEVEEIIPEAIEKVAGTDGESYNFVHYDRLIPYMIAYIQRLEQRISELEIR